MTDSQGQYDWSAYFDAVKETPPRETLVKALDLFDADGSSAGHRVAHAASQGGKHPHRRLAVDLGAGEGRDAAELLRRGWRVIAIDISEESPARMAHRLHRIGLGSRTHEPETGVQDVPVLRSMNLPITPIVARYEDAAWPRCDLVNASFSIPHCLPEDFPALWSKIADSLRPGGRFSGQFFGVNDEWARKPDGRVRTYHTRSQVETMLRGFEAEHLDEVERPGKNAFGEDKYWHVFHVVARKR